MRTLLATALATALVGSIGAADDQLNTAIGRPNRVLYRSIQDAREWRNPILIVQDEGVEVRAKGLVGVNGGKHASVEDLKALLISLPLNAWPYGRVVMQTDQGIVPDPADEYLRKLSQTRRRVAVVLESLGITAELWPS